LLKYSFYSNVYKQDFTPLHWIRDWRTEKQNFTTAEYGQSQEFCGVSCLGGRLRSPSASSSY